MERRLVVADRISTAQGHVGDALLIEGSLVTSIGQADDLRQPRLAEERYPGGIIVPGLRDAHFHPLVYGAVLRRLVLKDAADLAEVLSRVRAAAAELPPGQALIGSRLDDESLTEGRLPTRRDLDRAVSDRPVVLHRYCGHVAVANTAALEAAGIGPETPDPRGGTFDRDEAGIPNGILRETAVAALSRAIGGPANGLTPEQLLEAFSGLAKLGLTSIGAIVSLKPDPWCGFGGELESLLAVAEALPIKARVLVVAPSEKELESAAERIRDAGPRLTFLGMKAFGDGSLGGHTAALREPYRDRSDRTGTLRLDHAWATRVGQAALGLGGKVAVHAIGDLANARVLDVFEQLLEGGADPTDLRVEHASVLTDVDIQRFADLRVTASVQPAFLPSETGWLHKRLGPDGIRLAYRFRTLLEAGVPLAGGSDCPVEPPNPLRGIAAARDRAGIVPEEGLSAKQALGLFTDGAAAAMGEPPPLVPGSPADFVVLDRDPLDAEPAGLHASEVLSVWVDGRALELPEAGPVWPG
jgi:predicted amidohydrolase YtcJ